MNRATLSYTLFYRYSGKCRALNDGKSHIIFSVIATILYRKIVTLKSTLLLTEGNGSLLFNYTIIL